MILLSQNQKEAILNIEENKEPTLSIYGIVRKDDFRWIFDESYLILCDNFINESEKRFFMITLDGRILLYTNKFPQREIELFIKNISEFKGYYNVEIHSENKSIQLIKNGYMDFTGTFSAAINSITVDSKIKAKKKLDALIETLPRLKYAHMLRFFMEMDISSDDEAIYNIKNELTNYPDEFASLKIMGDYLYSKNKLKRARVFYGRALLSSPYNETLLLNLADIAAKLGENEEFHSLIPKLYGVNKDGNNFVHLDENLIIFFRKVENIYRKGGYFEVINAIDKRINKINENHKITFYEWCGEILSQVPSQISPYSLSELIDRSFEIFKRIDCDTLKISLSFGKFIDSILEKFSPLICEDFKIELLSIIRRLSEKYPDRVEFSSYYVRSLINMIDENSSYENLDENSRILENIKSFIKRDRCYKITSYTAISLLTAIINRNLESTCCHNEKVFNFLTMLWKSLIEIIIDFPEFANFTPIFLSLRRWDEKNIINREKFEKMVEILEQYMSDVKDNMTISNMNKAMEIAGAVEYFNN